MANSEQFAPLPRACAAYCASPMGLCKRRLPSLGEGIVRLELRAEFRRFLPRQLNDYRICLSHDFPLHCLPASESEHPDQQSADHRNRYG